MKFSNSKYRYVYHFFAFFIPVLAWLFIFFLWGQYPFGDNTLIIWDADGQYIPFAEMWCRVLHGEESLFYSLSDSIGGNVFVLFAYYQFSPLNLLVFFFKTYQLYKFFCLIFMIKVGLMGSTMYIYLNSKSNWEKPIISVLGAVSYSLSSYVVVYMFNHMWLDALILLPLVVLGIDMLVVGPREKITIGWLLSLSLAAVTITNFYMAMIICIFAFIYSLVTIITDSFGHKLNKCFSCFFSATLGMGISMIILLPCIMAILVNGQSDFESISISTNSGILKNLIWGSIPNNQITSGVPLLYCGMIITAGTCLYFIAPLRKISLLSKLKYAIILIFFMLSFRFSPLDALWGGGHESKGCPYRYSFIAIFIMIVIATDFIKIVSSDGIKWIIVDAAMMAVVLIDLCSNAANFYSISTEHSSKSNETFIENVSILKNLMETVDEEKNDLYRTEYGYAATSLQGNLPMFMGTHGLTAYSSVESNQKSEIINNLGYESAYGGYNLAYHEGCTRTSDALVGIRYIITQRYNENYNKIGDYEGFCIYDNDVGFPIAFYSEEAISEIDSANFADYFTWMNSILSIAVGEDTAVFSPLILTSIDVIDGEISGTTDRCTATKDHTQLMLIYSAQDVESSKPAYLRYGFSKEIGIKLNLYIDGEEINLEEQQNAMKNIGNVTGSSYIMLIITLDEGQNFELSRLGICTEDIDALKLVSNKVNADAPNIDVISDSHIMINAGSTDSEKTLVISIPNENGWEAFVDGKKLTKIDSALNGFMCIEIPSGKHDVELRFIPPGLIIGCVISLISIAVLIVCTNFNRVIDHRNS